MSEKAMWATMRKQMKLQGGWQEATRHEEAIQEGVADVSFVSNSGLHGWMELKKTAKWPARASTILRLDHYTDAQRAFLRRKGRAGGCAWLFLQVGRQYLLFDWLAAQHVGLVNRAQLEADARANYVGGCDWEALGQVLDDGANW